MTSQDIKTFSFLSYIGPFFLLGLFSDRRRNPRLRFHINQGMILAIAEATALAIHYFIDMLLGSIPFVSLIPSVLLIFITLCSIALSLYGIFNVACDRLRPLPVIGSLSLLK